MSGHIRTRTSGRGIREECVDGVAVVVALYVHWVFSSYRETAPIRDAVDEQRDRANRYIAQGSIHQFQDVARSADPALASGGHTARDSRSVGVIGRSRND